MLEDTDWMSREERALFDAARAMAPMLAAAESATRAARAVPQSHIDAIQDSRLIDILQPARFGGMQSHTRLFSRVVEEFAMHCASTAWVYAVLGEHQWIVASYPERAQIEVWGGNRRAVVSSSLVPRGDAKRVAGGWLVSGRYPFSSGCLHAQWVVVGAFCEAEPGHRHQRYMLMPVHEVSIVDDWRVLGLEGTGSRSLQLDEVFVPDHRSIAFADMIAGTPPGAAVHPDWPMVRAPRNMFAPFSQPPVVLSQARRLLAMVTDHARTRISRGVRRIADSELTHAKLAEAAAEIDLANRSFQWNRAFAVDKLYSGVPFTAMEMLRTRRDIVLAHRLVKTATDRLCDLMGASFVYDDHPMQPLLRDIQTCLTHGIANVDAAMLPYGRAMLGLPAAPPV